MKRIEFKEEVLSNLPLPQSGYKTLGVSDTGELSTIDSSGTIEAVGGGGGGSSFMERVKITLTSTQLQNDLASEIELIPAPGAGKILVPHSITLKIDVATTEESTFPDQQITVNQINGDWATVFDTNSGVWGDALEITTRIDSVYFHENINNSITIHAANNFVEFDGDIDIYITYEVLTL